MLLMNNYELKGCVEKWPKWLLINYRILLPSCLVPTCNKKENLTLHQSVTYGLFPRTPSITAAIICTFIFPHWFPCFLEVAIDLQIVTHFQDKVDIICIFKIVIEL